MLFNLPFKHPSGFFNKNSRKDPFPTKAGLGKGREKGCIGALGLGYMTWAAALSFPAWKEVAPPLRSCTGLVTLGGGPDLACPAGHRLPVPALN